MIDSRVQQGQLAEFDGLGRAGGGQCADSIVITVQVRDDTIVRIGYRCDGCADVLTAAAKAAELAAGLHLDDAAEISGETIAAALACQRPLPADKRHVGGLAAEALSNAIWDYIAGSIERGQNPAANKEE